MAELPRLGRLQPVDIRSLWADETRAFTPWLAEPDNHRLLGEALGMDLDLVQTESEVGSLFADKCQVTSRLADCDESTLVQLTASLVSVNPGQGHSRRFNFYRTDQRSPTIVRISPMKPLPSPSFNPE